MNRGIQGVLLRTRKPDHCQSGGPFRTPRLLPIASLADSHQLDPGQQALTVHQGELTEFSILLLLDMAGQAESNTKLYR